LANHYGNADLIGAETFPQREKSEKRAKMAFNQRFLMVNRLILLVAVSCACSCAHLGNPRITDSEAALVGCWKIESPTAKGVIKRTNKKQYEMSLEAVDLVGGGLYKERGEWSVVGSTYTMTCTFSDPLISKRIGSVSRAELLSVGPDLILMKYPDSPVISETRH
jgi:hypothetical protein